MLPFHDDNGTYSYDFHPNENGYAKLAQKWYNALIASDWLVAPINTTNNHLWKLESGSPYADEIGDSDAICSETACPEQIIGKVGNAVKFSSSSDKQVLEANVDGYDANESYTIEFWMKADSNTSSDNEVVVRHGDIWIGRNNNTLRYSLPGASANNTNVGTLSTGWNHVAVVYNVTEEEVKIYINAQNTKTDTITPTAMTERSFYIGHYYPSGEVSTDYAYNGAVDEVAIYRSVLSATEIEEHYAQGESAGEDTTPPVITLNGANPQQIELGADYIELNATVTDNVDTNLSVTIDSSEVNTDMEGNYTVIYSVKDSAGNVAEANRTVVVIDIQTVEVGPEGSIKSKLSVEDINVQKNEYADGRVRFVHESGAYIIGYKDGRVETGFDDSTLKRYTYFKLGTKSTMKQDGDKIIIETRVKLNKGESLVIGGKY
jgi:hypothetical protein